MDAYRAVVDKRDKRKFKESVVPEDILLRVLQAARMAGSGKNRQSCRIVVVTEAESRSHVAKSGDFGDWINESPVALVFAIHSEGGLRPDFDIGRMAQNAMIIANSEGLDSCPMTVYRQDDLREALAIPEEYDVPMVVGLGFPAEISDTKPTRSHQRKSLDEVIHWGKWE